MQILPSDQKDAGEHAQAEGGWKAEKAETAIATILSVIEIRAVGEFGTTEGAADTPISRGTAAF